VPFPSTGPLSLRRNMDTPIIPETNINPTPDDLRDLREVSRIFEVVDPNDGTVPANRDCPNGR
jgi:hypothetical protein